jgi:hypothetical protein
VDWDRDSGASNFSRISGAERESLTSYVESNTTGDKDRYELEDPAPTVNSRVALVPVAIAVAPSGGAPEITMRLHVGAGSVVGDPLLLVGTAGTVMSTPLFERPAGGAWTASDVEDAELELEAV